ncbi:MAG TPA: hypothetical protein VEI06_07685 [Gemmatimonadaceae bacterium]|nr:hypothetical protein [Gemmatimonadaceae bacterium]
MPVRTDSERAGIMIGILVSVLIALGVYFYWRGTGARALLERNAPPPPATAPARPR